MPGSNNAQSQAPKPQKSSGQAAAKAANKFRRRLEKRAARMAKEVASAERAHFPSVDGREVQVRIPVSTGIVGSGSRLSVERISHRGSDAIRVRGTDFMTRAEWTAAMTSGTTLYNSPLNPTLWNGTRVKQLCDTYEKYRFNGFRIRVRPAAPSTVTGSYGITYDHDPSDPTPQANDVGVREFLAHKGTKDFSAWMNGWADFRPDEPLTDFFLNPIAGGDERLVDQGQVYVWCLTPLAVYPADANFTISLIVEIEYDLVLYCPQITSGIQGLQLGASGSDGTAYPNAATRADLLARAAGLAGTTTPSIPDPVKRGLESLLKVDSNGKAFFDVAQGVWSLIQNGSVYMPLSLGNTFGQPPLQMNVPVVTANKPEEQDLIVNTPIQILNPVNSASSASANTRIVTSRQDAIGIPPGGAKIRLTGGGSDAPFGSTCHGLTLGIDLQPGVDSFIPGYAAASRPGKHGREKMAALRAKLLAESQNSTAHPPVPDVELRPQTPLSAMIFRPAS